MNRTEQLNKACIELKLTVDEIVHVDRIAKLYPDSSVFWDSGFYRQIEFVENEVSIRVFFPKVNEYD